MLITDGRVRTMNEILSSIKLIKMYAWEDSFEKKIAGKTLDSSVLTFSSSGTSFLTLELPGENLPAAVFLLDVTFF